MKVTFLRSKTGKVPSEARVLIVGLGNPGEKYIGVRHNLGFDIVEDFVAKKFDRTDWLFDKNLKSEILKKDNLLFAKPQTFMNNSGMAVKLIVSVFNIKPEDIIVIYDELDLPLGKIKVRLGGAAAGHHGVESIINSLSTDKFIRVRLGIGNLRTQSGERKGQSVSAEKFVLEPFMHSEKPQLKHMLKQATKALQILLEEGLEKAQTQFN